MKKGYWISAYTEITDPKKLAAYAKLAGPAIVKAGGTFLVRGLPTKTYEHGIKERTVVVEFKSVEAAVNAHDSFAYTEALNALGNGAKRDIRIVESAQ